MDSLEWEDPYTNGGGQTVEEDLIAARVRDPDLIELDDALEALAAGG